MTVFHIHFPHCDLIHNGDVAPQNKKVNCRNKLHIKQKLKDSMKRTKIELRSREWMQKRRITKQIMCLQSACLQRVKCKFYFSGDQMKLCHSSVCCTSRSDRRAWGWTQMASYVFHGIPSGNWADFPPLPITVSLTGLTASVLDPALSWPHSKESYVVSRAMTLWQSCL
jgi:hypothetical protein